MIFAASIALFRRFVVRSIDPPDTSILLTIGALWLTERCRNKALHVDHISSTIYSSRYIHRTADKSILFHP